MKRIVTLIEQGAGKQTYYKLYLELDGPNEGSRYHQSKLVIPESETEY